MKFFAVVDEYEVDSETKKLCVKNPDRSSKVIVNRPAFTSPDGVFHPAACRSIDCRDDGIYAVSEKHEFFKEAMAVMGDHVARSGGKLIGPFDSTMDAMVAREKLRPKTPEEKLKARNAELEAELAAAKKNVKTVPAPVHNSTEKEL